MAERSESVASADVGKGMDAGEIVGVQHGHGFVEIQRAHASVEDRAHFGVCLNVVKNGCAENFVEAGLSRLNGVMQTVPAGEQVVEHLRACAVGAGGVGAQSGRKRRVVEVAIRGFLKKP